MQQTGHAFPLFAYAQKPNARKSGKARRMWLSVMVYCHDTNLTGEKELLHLHKNIYARTTEYRMEISLAR